MQIDELRAEIERLEGLLEERVAARKKAQEELARVSSLENGTWATINKARKELTAAIHADARRRCAAVGVKYNSYSSSGVVMHPKHGRLKVYHVWLGNVEDLNHIIVCSPRTKSDKGWSRTEVRVPLGEVTACE